MIQRLNSKTVLLLILIIISIFINLITLKNGHNWGGDFAQYIINAKNIVEGKPYDSGIMLDLPLLYAPGYPLLIAPIIKYFGVNFILLKLPNIFFWYFFVFFSYKLVSRYIDKETSVLFCVLLAVSSDFFTFKQNVLSDLPFNFFAALSIFLFYKYLDNYGSKNRAKFLFLTICCMAYSFLVRTAGVTLFFAAILYLLIIKKNYWDSLKFALGFIAVYLAQKLSVGNNPGFFYQMLEGKGEYFVLALQANSLTFRSILWSIIPGYTNYTGIVFAFLNKVLLLISPVIFLGVGLKLFYALRKDNPDSPKGLIFVEGFSFIYLMMLLLWSGFPAEPRSFTRYIYPLLPITFIYLYKIVLFVFEKIRLSPSLAQNIVKMFLFFFLLLNLYNIVLAFDYNDDVLFRKENQEMFQWVKNSTNDKETYMTWRPRPIALMTGKVGIAPWISHKNPLSQLSYKLDNYNARYIIVSKESDKFLIDICENQKDFSDLVWENATFKIYKVRKVGK